MSLIIIIIIAIIMIILQSRPLPHKANLQKGRRVEYKKKERAAKANK